MACIIADPCSTGLKYNTSGTCAYGDLYGTHRNKVSNTSDSSAKKTLKQSRSRQETSHKPTRNQPTARPKDHHAVTTLSTNTDHLGRPVVPTSLGGTPGKTYHLYLQAPPHLRPLLAGEAPIDNAEDDGPRI